MQPPDHHRVPARRDPDAHLGQVVMPTEQMQACFEARAAWQARAERYEAALREIARMSPVGDPHRPIDRARRALETP